MATLAVVFCEISSHRLIISSATSLEDLLRRSFVQRDRQRQRER